MARVTSAFLIVSDYGGVSEGQITGFTFSEDQCFVKADDGWDDNLGGYKHVEVDIYVAGFNYVDGEELEVFFKRLPWDSGSAFLVWETNGSDKGSISVNWPSRSVRA